MKTWFGSRSGHRSSSRDGSNHGSCHSSHASSDVDESGSSDEFASEDAPSVATAKTTTTAKRSSGIATRRLFSRSGTQPTSKVAPPKAKGFPSSPVRSSNYNHMKDAVKANFDLALSDHSKELVLGAVGLRNLGNTCFLNSSLQCLINTIPLTDYFLGYDYKSEINADNALGSGGKLVSEYAQLTKSMWLGKKTVVAPTKFKTSLEDFAPRFAGGRQHDAQEVLSFLLDGIHEDLNRIMKKPYTQDPDFNGTNDAIDAINAWKNHLRRDKSPIVDIFQGQLKTTLTCLQCGHKNIRFEAFMYLSLPMNDSCKTLDDCLQLYLQEEKLTGDNKWHCSKCKAHRDASRKTDIWILPPILIVHLKRFKCNDSGYMGAKKTEPVEYPITKWDLSDSMARQGGERPVFDLYAVANQIGSMVFGHYTAFCQNRFDDRWYEFNDESVNPISTGYMQKNCSSAYLLFYNRSAEERSDGRAPMIRRQSGSRPDLWPHAQVQNNDYRQFSRSSLRRFHTQPPLETPPLLGPLDGDGRSLGGDPNKATENAVVDTDNPLEEDDMTEAEAADRLFI